MQSGQKDTAGRHANGLCQGPAIRSHNLYTRPIALENNTTTAQPSSSVDPQCTIYALLIRPPDAYNSPHISQAKPCWKYPDVVYIDTSVLKFLAFPRTIFTVFPLQDPTLIWGNLNGTISPAVCGPDSSLARGRLKTPCSRAAQTAPSQPSPQDRAHCNSLTCQNPSKFTLFKTMVDKEGSALAQVLLTGR
ncbi:hypothetical protein MHYP_G00229870 [Metynnis hypsauchen]